MERLLQVADLPDGEELVRFLFHCVLSSWICIYLTQGLMFSMGTSTAL